MCCDAAAVRFVISFETASSLSVTIVLQKGRVVNQEIPMNNLSCENRCAWFGRYAVVLYSAKSFLQQASRYVVCEGRLKAANDMNIPKS